MMVNPQASRDRHRDRVIVGEKEKGAGPLSAFQRLASGVVNLDQSGVVQGRRGNRARLNPEDLPVVNSLSAGSPIPTGGFTRAASVVG